MQLLNEAGFNVPEAHLAKGRWIPFMDDTTHLKEHMRAAGERKLYGVGVQ